MLQNCFRMWFVDSTTHPIIKWKALNSQDPWDSCNRQQVRCHKTHDSSPWGALGKQWVHWLVTIVKSRQAKHVQFFQSWMEMKCYFHETASIRCLFFCCLHSSWDENMARLPPHTSLPHDCELRICTPAIVGCNSQDGGFWSRQMSYSHSL